jgi:hypothetical protein
MAERLQPINSNTIGAIVEQDLRLPVEVEVGDIKQSQFLPRAKSKFIRNKFNWSLGLPLNIIGMSENPYINVNDDFALWQNSKMGMKTYFHPRNKPVIYKDYRKRIHREGALEFEAIIFERPPSPTIAFTLKMKDLDVYKQPYYDKPTIEELIKNPLAGQADDISGSHAFYFKDGLAGDYSLIGGDNLLCGKAFHLYRFWIVDANGNFAWCDTIIDKENELALVTIPLDFYNGAVLPWKIMPTFGYTTAGANNGGSLAANQYIGFQFTCGGSGDVSSISAYMVSSGADSGVKFAIVKVSDYKFLTNGIAPEIIETKNVTKWWTSNYVNKPTVSNGVNYFLGGLSNAGPNIYRDVSGPNYNVLQDYSNNYSYPTDPTDGILGYANYIYSIYATYGSGVNIAVLTYGFEEY